MEEGNKLSGDLMSSGKVVAEAAMSAFQQKSVENVDEKKVAGATAEILDSASTYGKLEDKPVGQYFEKAEVYLKQYSSGTEKEKSDAPAGDAPKPEAEEAPKEPAPAPAAEEGKSSQGFGLDDVKKGAESLMEKKSSGEESADGGGGGLFKMAQGFMK